ncbi:hypothetical protein ACQP2F_10310 [Actinoplanes sp. CA-030573]|uniref:hypothetical protein n=1 Tax=Actinoplanes sp. CA-030573 TaxID=3239898 RepID=UPI003D8DCFB0
MMDLHDRLSALAGPAGSTTTDQADADVIRGRRALLRRRAARGAGASVFAAAAVAAAISYGVSGGNGAASSPSGATAAGSPATGSPATGSPAVVATRLVAYRGEQPKGFTIDKVPAGWEVQGGNAAALTIAPVGLEDKNPDSFVDKIAIMLQSADDKSQPTGTAVTVAGNPGVINPGLGTDHGKNLWVKVPAKGWMLVQIWDARGWSDAKIVEFGAGIHVLPGAVQGHG